MEIKATEMKPTVEYEIVDPHRMRWQRHPTRPRTWVTDDGKLYVFAAGQKEVIIRMKGNPFDDWKRKSNSNT